MFFGIFGVDVAYSMQLAAKMKRFAEEKEIVIRYEELKAQLAHRRQERELKARFFFSFKMEESLRQTLEHYADLRRDFSENIEKKYHELEDDIDKMRR